LLASKEPLMLKELAFHSSYLCPSTLFMLHTHFC